MQEGSKVAIVSFINLLVLLRFNNIYYVTENKSCSILLHCWFGDPVEYSEHGEDTIPSTENGRNFAHLSLSILLPSP